MNPDTAATVQSFKQSMTVIAANGKPQTPPTVKPATPKEKAFTRDVPARKRAVSLKNQSIRTEVSAKETAATVDKTHEQNGGGHFPEEITAIQGSSQSLKNRKSNKTSRARSKKDASRTTNSFAKDTMESLINNQDLEEDEPVIPNFDYAAFLDRHYQKIGPGVHRMNYKYAELKTVVTAAQKMLLAEPTLIEVRAPVIVCGDVHGQFNDLQNMFILMGKPPTHRYLFLGDYVDRGAMSLECITMLLSYKILYPNHVFLLRGNHECGRVNKKYGFFEELELVFPGPKGAKVWAMFQRVFNVLPVGGIIEKKIFCMHGGLSPLLYTLDELREEKKPIKNPAKGLVNDMLWAGKSGNERAIRLFLADPFQEIAFWRTSVRGSGFCFGDQVVNEICEQHGFDLILRAHQLCMDGFWSFAGGKLLTLFSAPAYCNVFKNAASALRVDENLRCSLVAFVPEGPQTRAMITERQRLWEPEGNPTPNLPTITVLTEATSSMSTNVERPPPPLPRPC